jgi:hypothetical protein
MYKQGSRKLTRVGKHENLVLMKKLIVAGLIGMSVLALSAYTDSNTGRSESDAACECNYGRCSKIKADGYQCKNCAQQGSYYCWSHR